jgi:hypothetical protein
MSATLVFKSRKEISTSWDEKSNIFKDHIILIKLKYNKNNVNMVYKHGLRYNITNHQSKCKLIRKQI